MGQESHIRKPPIIIPPAASSANPATLIFIHGYQSSASRFNLDSFKHRNVAQQIHKSPSLRHLKIILPEAVPSRHPSVLGNVWYNIPKPIPDPGDPKKAKWYVEFGNQDNNAQDMETTMDYFESLIKSEIANGTPARRIVFMGFSQGSSILVLFLLTRRLAADLGAVISYAGFPALDLKSVLRMQREKGLEGRWSKETTLFLMLGRNDIFVTLEIAQAWRDQLQGLCDRGQGIATLEWKLIDEAQHAVSDHIWPHVRGVLERTIPTRGKPLVKL
jgi:predicted esterase